MTARVIRFSFVCLLAALALGIGSNHTTGDHDNDHLYPHEPGGHNVITRNVVLGNPITVCSTDYPNATAAAISAPASSVTGNQLDRFQPLAATFVSRNR